MSPAHRVITAVLAGVTLLASSAPVVAAAPVDQPIAVVSQVAAGMALLIVMAVGAGALLALTLLDRG